VVATEVGDNAVLGMFAGNMPGKRKFVIKRRRGGRCGAE
jgi:hypothetical protein